MKAFHVTQWLSEHENAASRQVWVMTWYSSPSKHDGLGFAYLRGQADREALYGSWKAILDVASRGSYPMRGWLVRAGKALSVQDVAAMTGFREEIIRRAFEFFMKPEVGWLEEREFVENPPVERFRVKSGEGPSPSGRHPDKSGEGPSPSATHPSTTREIDREITNESTGDQKKGAEPRVNGAEGLKVQWAALNDQVKVLEGKKAREGLSGEERAELRQKKAARDEVQRKQAAGEF